MANPFVPNEATAGRAPAEAANLMIRGWKYFHPKHPNIRIARAPAIAAAGERWATRRESTVEKDDQRVAKRSRPV